MKERERVVSLLMLAQTGLALGLAPTGLQRCGPQ